MVDNLKKGSLIELECIRTFTELGYYCYLPFSDGAKCDIIIDINSRLYKIQCKSSRWCKDTKKPNVAFEFSTVTHNANTKGYFSRPYSSNDVDYFYTFFNGKSYLIPLDATIGKSNFRMRYKYPKYGNKGVINIESDYDFDKIIKKLY